MTGVLIIVACLVASPDQCQTISTGVIVDVAVSSGACSSLAEAWVHTKLDETWFIKHATCGDGFMEEDK